MFVDVVQKKKKCFVSRGGAPSLKVVAWPNLVSGSFCSTTVRSRKCEILTTTSGRRCQPCQKTRAQLRDYYKRSQTPSSPLTASKFAKNSSLSTPQRSGKFAQLARKTKFQQRKIMRLKNRIKAWTEKRSIEVQPDLSSDIEEIAGNSNKEICAMFPKGSFQRLFWEQQVDASKRKRPTGRRWDPLYIRWALSIKMQSSSEYDQIRRSGFLLMPSERTLSDYVGFWRSGEGLTAELNEQLAHSAQISELQEGKKFVALSFDEMKIRQDLVFDKHSCKVGFANLDSVSNELKQLASTSSNLKVPKSIATSMLVFMIRGIFTSFKFPYAHFLAADVVAENLFSTVWEIIRNIESIGLKVMTITSDGAASNRKFYKMHQGEGPFVYQTENIYSVDRRPIFFVCDAPHLIKITRNCFSHSYPGNKARAMWVSSVNICC